MALIKCEDCGRDVSDKAPSCPNCGCPVPSPAEGVQPPPLPSGGSDLPAAWIAAPLDQSDTSSRSVPGLTPTKKGPLGTGTKVVLALLGMFLSIALLVAVSEMLQPTRAPATTAPSYDAAAAQAAADAAVRAADAAAQTAAAAAAAAVEPNWTYTKDTSDISGKPSYHARSLSTNSFQLEFPYEGEQRGTLHVRNHARYGNDVIVTIDEGQILCHTYDCSITVRFDDEPAFKVTGTEPGNNDSTAVFVPIYTRLMKKVPTAKRLRVELNLYQAPPQTLDFNIEGFDLEQFRGSTK